METLILTQSDVRAAVTVERAVSAVEHAFDAHGRGQALMPPKVYLSLEKYDGDFRAMPAYLDGSAGVKWVNSHPQNPARHELPSVMGVYILSDPETARPLAIMDATWLTALRTGAAGAVASKYLAMPHPRSLGLIGCGVQAHVLLAAHRMIYGELEWLMADADPDRARAFAAEAGGRAVSVAEAAGADIVCTATPSHEPVVKRAWLSGRAHVNAMGADAPGKQELDPAILNDALVVIDDHHQATGSGEINVPLAQGAFSESDIHATLGEIVAGTRPGRQGEQITVFDSTGLAIQDVALARAVYEAALSEGVGTAVDLMDGG